jgi:hypothetical protein
MPIPESEIERMEMESRLDFALGRSRQYIRNPKPQQHPNFTTTRPQSLAQLFSICAELESREDQIAFLNLNKHSSLRLAAEYALNPNIKFLVNPAECSFLPYDPAQSLTLWQEMKRYYLFVESNPFTRPNPIANNPEKMKQKFEDLCSSLLEDDRQLAIQILRKQVPLPDPTILFDVYPDLKTGVDVEEDQRKHARLYAENNLQGVVKESQARIRGIDESIRQNEEEHQNLLNLREREFHKMRMAGLHMGSLL